MRWSARTATARRREKGRGTKGGGAQTGRKRQRTGGGDRGPETEQRTGDRAEDRRQRQRTGDRAEDWRQRQRAGDYAKPRARGALVAVDVRGVLRAGGQRQGGPEAERARGREGQRQRVECSSDLMQKYVGSDGSSCWYDLKSRGRRCGFW